MADMLAEPAIWSASPLESAWHKSIAESWTHEAFCDACPESDARCPEGVALREAEQDAWRASVADRYVPIALGTVRP